MQNLQKKTVRAHEFFGDNQHFGSLRPRIALRWYRACYFLWATIPAWGGNNSHLGGTAPECLPVTLGLPRLMIGAEMCVHNTEKILKHSNVNFVSDPGVLPIAGIFLSSFIYRLLSYLYSFSGHCMFFIFNTPFTNTNLQCLR